MADYKAKVLANVEAYIAELEEARRGFSFTLMRHGYIVEVDGVFIGFPIVDGKPNPAPMQPHLATRFEFEACARIAPTVRNGAGKSGVPVHVKDAVDRAIMQQIVNLNALKDDNDEHTVTGDGANSAPT